MIRRFGSETVLCVLCDGTGEAAGGTIASSLALESFADSLGKSFLRGIPRDPALIGDALLRARARALTEAARKAGSRDNITVLTADF